MPVIGMHYKQTSNKDHGPCIVPLPELRQIMASAAYHVFVCHPCACPVSSRVNDAPMAGRGEWGTSTKVLCNLRFNLIATQF